MFKIKPMMFMKNCFLLKLIWITFSIKDKSLVVELKFKENQAWKLQWSKNASFDRWRELLQATQLLESDK